MTYTEDLEKRVEELEGYLASYRHFVIKSMTIEVPFGYDMTKENTDLPITVSLNGLGNETIRLTAPYETFLHIGVNRTFFQFIHERLPTFKQLESIKQYIIDYRHIKDMKKKYDEMFTGYGHIKKIRQGAKLREMCDKIEVAVEGRIF
jgi:hypothetical protein